MKGAGVAFSWTMLLASASGCGGPPYPAPPDSTISLIQEESSGVLIGDVDRLTTVVKDSEGVPLNGISVVAQSYAPTSYILIPETAISTSSDSEAEWATAAEEYLQTLEVDDGDVQPDILETTTDKSGNARVYVYIKCIPTDCLNYSTGLNLTSCDLLANDFGGNPTGTVCSAIESGVTISTTADSVYVAYAAEFTVTIP